MVNFWGCQKRQHKLLLILEKAGIAQLVEQWIENPRVSSSNLDPGNREKKKLTNSSTLFFV